MFPLIIAIVLIGVSLVYYHSGFGKFQRAINKIPGPPTLPVVGNAHMIGKNLHEILGNQLKWWRQYGCDKFRFWIFSEGTVVISDPKDVENILLSTKILKKSKVYNLLHPWMGQGILTSYGSRWKNHRKILLPSFHFKVLVDFLGIMNVNSSKFIEKLKKISEGDIIFDIQGIICLLTLDIICETAMGVSINAMDDCNSDISKSFQYMCYSVQIRGFNLHKELFFKFTPEYTKYKRALKTLKDFTTDVIAKHRKTIKNNTKPNIAKEDIDDYANIRQKQAFLNTLLASPLKDKDVFEEVTSFMFAGHDTTSSGLNFAIYLLSRHPEVQQKVLNEQMEIFNVSTRHATYKDIQEMKYLEMVIKEAQRMYPSVPIIARVTEAEYNMNGTLLPRGTAVNIFIIGMGYNEKYFPNPYKFDPERFNTQTRVKSNPFTFVPFSAGPRNCLGQKFAMMEMKAIIGSIVRAFIIRPPDDRLYSKDGYEQKQPKDSYDPVLSAVLTLKSENGIHIRLSKRNA